MVTGKEAGANSKTAVVTATESNGGATCTYTITVKVWNGSGTSSSPYQISNLRDIKKLSEKVNTTSTSADDYTYKSKYFKQTANIPLGGSTNGSWTPIGKDATRFNGTYDGGNKTITGLYINSTQVDQGLFGNTDTNSTIKNLTISNAYIYTNNETAAVLVALNRGNITNVKITGGSIKAKAYIGGISGWSNSGTITSCSNSASISYVSSSTDNMGWMIGGVIGRMDNGTVTKCINTGQVTGTHSAAGVVGEFYSGTILLSVNKGVVLGKAANDDQGTSVGGIAGDIGWRGNATIINCYNTGSITSVESGGGIASVGGAYEGGNITIKNCYNIGTVNAKSGGADGAVLGGVYTKNCTYTLSNNYFLSTCGGTQECFDIDTWAYKSYSGITSRTATQLKSLTSTLGSAYKADSNNINNGYPILSWQ